MEGTSASGRVVVEEGAGAEAPRVSNIGSMVLGKESRGRGARSLVLWDGWWAVKKLGELSMVDGWTAILVEQGSSDKTGYVFVTFPLGCLTQQGLGVWMMVPQLRVIRYVRHVSRYNGGGAHIGCGSCRVRMKRHKLDCGTHRR